MKIKKILLLCCMNTLFVWIFAIYPFCYDKNNKQWVGDLFLCYIIILLGLFIIRYIFQKINIGILRFLLTLICAYSVSVLITVLLCINLPLSKVAFLENIIPILYFSVTINIILFFLWLTVGAINFTIFYTHYHNASRIEA